MSKQPLHGRRDECDLLLQAYLRSTQRPDTNSFNDPTRTGTQELVLIRGHSGTGKTALAHSIAERVVADDGGFFLSGKFELGNFHNPYDVFVSAFGEFPELLKACSDNTRRESIRQAVREAVGSEGKLLTDMIPTLEDIIGPHGEIYPANGSEAVNRFQFVFSKFVRSISSVAPLVVFLDDLQWSDPTSLSLLRAILESQPEPNQPPRVLLICSFRDEGLDEAPMDSSARPTSSTPFTGFLEQVSASARLHRTEIKLDNWNEASTCRFVAEYMGMSSEGVERLGQIIFSKCGGNPFHVLQVMDLIKHRRDLMETKSAQRCGQDENGFIEVAQAAIDSADEFIRHKLSVLPQLVQDVLQVAACVGDCIDHPAVCTIFDGNVSGVEKSLQIALQKGLLILDTKLGQFRFAHDRIRQAILSTVDDVRAMSFRIGHQLWTKASPMYLCTKMFVIVSLLNHGIDKVLDRKERYKAAEINLEAGLKAISLAAFPDACLFLQAGLDFLNGGDYWTEEYKLSLTLFNATADAEMGNQNYARVAELVEEILKHARTLKDKLPAYSTLISCMGQRGDTEAAIRVGADVLKQLDCPLPSKVSKLSIVIECIKAKLALRGLLTMSDLPFSRMQDEDKIAAVYLLSTLFPYTFQASSNYCPYMAARIVRLSLKNGMHKCCAPGIGVFAFILCTMNTEEGVRLGKLALSLIERYRARELLPRVHMTYYGFTHHWKHPLKESWAPLENAVKVGMEIGDIENAAYANSCHTSNRFFGGAPLHLVEEILLEGNRKMSKQESILETMGPNHQFIHNLTGRAPVPKMLEGNIVALYDPSRKVEALIIPFSHYLFGADLAFMFGDLDRAAELLDLKRQLGFQAVGIIVCAVECFKEALIRVALARQSSSNRGAHIKAAKYALKRLKNWAKDCPNNFLHKQHLLEAELQSLGARGRSSPQCHVRALYERATEGAIKEGFVQDAALAKELAGDFCSRQNDAQLAGTYWDEAHSLYLEWGATEKAKYLLSVGKSSRSMC